MRSLITRFKEGTVFITRVWNTSTRLKYIENILDKNVNLMMGSVVCNELYAILFKRGKRYHCPLLPKKKKKKKNPPPHLYKKLQQCSIRKCPRIQLPVYLFISGQLSIYLESPFTFIYIYIQIVCTLQCTYTMKYIYCSCTLRCIVSLYILFSYKFILCKISCLRQNSSSDSFLTFTALPNHNRTVIEEMKAWTALSWHIGMKTAFQTRYMKSKWFRPSVMKN